MSQTTLEQAATWVANRAGLSLKDDCARVLELTNDVRELIYDLSPVPWRTTLCAPVRCLCAECGTGCSPTYAGLSLPSYVNNVLAVWQDSRPMPITDRWGIYPYDAEWDSQTTHQAVDMGAGYPFMDDPPCNDCYQLAFIAKSKDDSGKILTIRYIDRNNKDRYEEIPLSDLWQSPKYPVRRIQANGVTLPMDRKGQVVARMENGQTLSVWEPWEIVPEYRRLKLPALECCHVGKMISVHAERRFVRLSNFRDVVETDKKLIWEDGYDHLTLHRKREGDGQDLQNALKFVTSFKAKLEIEASAGAGKTKRIALRFAPVTSRRSGLRSGR